MAAANAQEVVKDPIIIRNEEFKEVATIGDALDHIYKRIIPKKSTRDPATCFWMLGDKKYLIVLAGYPNSKQLGIEPMLIKRVVDVENDGMEYVINKNDRASLADLKSSIGMYCRLAQANDVDPIIMVARSESLLAENLVMLRMFRELGVKQIYISAPVKVEVASPVIPLPKKRPASPHR